MEYAGEYEEVFLTRANSGQPWGFRLMGGRDQGTMLYMAKVAPRSLAERFGLRVGDGVMKIGMVPALYLNHDQAKAEILRAGNEIYFCVKRGAVPAATIDAEPQNKTRSVVEEESTKYRGNINSKTQSRSFRILTDALVEELDDVQ